MDLPASLPTGLRKGLATVTARTRALLRRRVWRTLLVLTFLTALPFGSWLLGSGVAWAAPHTYQSSAVVQFPASLDRAAVEKEQLRMRSPEVVELASRALAEAQSLENTDPMDAYLLWSSLDTQGVEGANSIRVAVRASDAGQARRRLQAVVSAYHQVSPGEVSDSLMASVTPVVDSTPVRVSDEVRIILGIAGAAAVALLLSIPLLKQMERLEASQSPATA